MREKFSVEKKSSPENRASLMSNSINFILNVRKRYEEDDPCFYLDKSKYDLYEREVFGGLYGDAALHGWMLTPEKENLKKLLKQVYEDWRVQEARKQKINYDHPEKDERL